MGRRGVDDRRCPSSQESFIVCSVASFTLRFFFLCGLSSFNQLLPSYAVVILSVQRLREIERVVSTCETFASILPSEKCVEILIRYFSLSSSHIGPECTLERNLTALILL